MRVIITLDDACGRTLFGKRLSKDRTVNADILERFGFVYVSEYTASLFKGDERAFYPIPDSVPESATLFLEKEEIQDCVTELVVYRWNRLYPSDSHYDPEKNGWRKISSDDFAGYSHKKITREVYVR